MCSQAHLLTYANKYCTSEHFLKRDSFRLRLALLLEIDPHSRQAAAAWSQRVSVHIQSSREQSVLLIPTNPAQNIPMCERQEPSAAPQWVVAHRSGAASLSLD